MIIREWFYLQIQGYPVVAHYEEERQFYTGLGHYEFFGVASDTGYRSHFFYIEQMSRENLNYIEFAQLLCEELFKETWNSKKKFRGDFSKPLPECAKEADMLELLSINLLISNLL